MKPALNLEKILSELADDSQLAMEELFNYYYPRLYNFSKAFLKLKSAMKHYRKCLFNANYFCRTFLV
jgi:hypothetical protein